MAAPTLVGEGGPDSGTGGISVEWPVGHQVDDIGILVVQSANETVSTPAGWTLIGNVGTGTAGAVGSTALWVFWKRATSAAEANVSVADPGDHARGKMIAIRGCETSGSPVDGSAVTGTAASATAVSIANPTTTVAETYVISLVGNATDVTNNQTTVGSWVNAALSGFTRIINGNTSAGVGGGMDGGGGAKATAGAVGNSTSTLATASAQAKIAFALKPPAGGGGGTVTEGGIFVASALKATAGVVGTTTASMDAASVQARLVFALKPPAAPPANEPPVVSGLPAVRGAVDTTVFIPITYVDPDGDTVTFTLVAGATEVPTGAEVLEDESSGNWNIEWTPDSTQAGEWTFLLRATDGTNTVDTDVSITVEAASDTTILELAISLAERAQTDVESAQALAELLDEHEQMNANVIKEVRELVADLEASATYFQGIVTELEEEAEEL